MNLYCIGINHRTASLGLREKMWFSEDEVRSFLEGITGLGIKESVLISTCNRTELYYVPESPSINETLVLKNLIAYKQAENIVNENNFYFLRSLHAVQHLFKLASGVDSMVLGDIQILHQLKTAYAIAQDLQRTGSVLHKVFSSAFHAGKRARKETEIDEGAISVGYAAAELASKIFQDLSQRTALLIGAGETAELTAKHLCSAGLGKLFIANRTRERAEILASQLNGTVLPFESFRECMPQADIIISSIASPSYILQPPQAQEAMKRRGNKPLFVIDLGVPRTIDPAIQNVGNVFLHDIDVLHHIVDKNIAGRRAAIPSVNRIVLETLTELHYWFESLDIIPTINDLRKQFEDIRYAEVDKYYHHFSPESQEEISILTKRIINKLLHVPMVNLKSNLNNEERRKHISLIRSLFGLDMVKGFSTPGAK